MGGTAVDLDRTPATRTRPTRLDASASALAAAALWGGMYVVSKDTFDRIPPITLGALRLLLAGAALALFLRIRGPLHRPRDRRLLLAGGLLAGTLIVQFVGTDLATASEGALLTTTTPLFIVPLAWVALQERPSATTVVGILVGMAGVALAVGGGVSLSRSPWGPILLLVSAAGWAAYTTASARMARREGPLAAVTWATIVAIPLVGLLALVEAGRWEADAFSNLPTLGAVAYLGLAASAGAWYLWNRGVAGLPAAVTGAFFFVQPVVGGILARALLGEPLGAAFVAGGALILAGVLLTFRSQTPGPGRSAAQRPSRTEPKEVP